MTENDYEQSLAPIRYYDQHFKREAVKILPGEYYVTTQDMLIVTVLGSCVSVCLRDKRTGIGGMNHFMLPGESDSNGRALGSSARYGSYATEILIDHLLQLGAQRQNLEAKVFGGGRVLSGFTVNQVGDRNAEFVLDYLRNEKIPIIAQDLIDIYPRKIYFFPASGRVLVRKLKTLHNDTIAEREIEYQRKLANEKIVGNGG